MKRILFVILALVVFPLTILAQEGLAIQEAFSRLAVRRNATEVVMSSGRLKEYRLSYFHSLEIADPQASERKFVEDQVKADAAHAVLREETASHSFYEMPPRKGTHRYILYRYRGQTLTLIYLEGKASLAQIKSFFRRPS